MDEATQSTLNKIEKYQTVCRFCFGKRDVDEVFFDIFNSNIKERTIFDIMKDNFAVLETTSYYQCVTAQCWTSDYLEVVDFAINDDNTIMRGICVRCFQILIEIDSLANEIRKSNIEQFGQAEFITKLKAWDLKTRNDMELSHEQILTALNYKEQSDYDGLLNFCDTCRICLQHNNNMFLFDILTSTIGDTSVRDVIKMCTSTYKQQIVNVFVHLRKSYVKSILIPDYIWPEIEDGAPRQICLECLEILIKFKFLIDRIRKTNAGLALADLSCNLKGKIGINPLHTTLENILDKCVLRTSDGGIVSTQEILNTIKLAKSENPKCDPNKNNKTLLTPYQSCHTDYHLEENLKKQVFGDHVGANLYIFCKLCNNFIENRSDLDDHILMHIQAASKDKASNVCRTCLRFIITGDNRLQLNDTDDSENCSMCKLRTYLDHIDETTMTFEEFSKL